MFRCQNCNTVVPPNTKATPVVVQRRPQSYEERSAEVQGRRGRARTRIIDRGGDGHEIVRELKVCPTCADVLDEAPIPEKPVREEYEPEDYELEDGDDDGDDDGKPGDDD